MKSFIVLILACMLFPILSKAQNEEAKAGIRWGWTNYGGPGWPCSEDEIAPGLKRGGLNPRQCLERAIAASKSGNDQLALRWIATIQCHNGSARNSILSGGIESVKYLMNTYGGGYGPSTPAPNPAQVRECVVTVNNRTNMPLELYGIRFKAGQNIACETLTYLGVLGAGQSWTDTPLPEGWDVWLRFKTSRSNGCTSSDEKFQIFGIGTFAARKVYDIN